MKLKLEKMSILIGTKKREEHAWFTAVITYICIPSIEE